MITDSILKKAEEKHLDQVTWGSYDNHYDWQWTDRPLLIPKTPKVTAAVMLRDWTIAKKLKELGIKKVLDVGSDTGHFMAVLKYNGIDAVGIDANKTCCDFITSKGQNSCYNIGIDTLCTLTTLEGYDCITCMNITQAKWEDEELKQKFIKWLSQHYTYALLSDMTHQDRSWDKLKLVYDFNFLPLYCSKFVVRCMTFFKIDTIVAYSCIQKLYKITK